MERSTLKFVAEKDGEDHWAYFAEYPSTRSNRKALWLGDYDNCLGEHGLNESLERKGRHHPNGIDYSSATVCDDRGVERIHTVMPAWLLCPWLTKKDMLNQLDIKES